MCHLHLWQKLWLSHLFFSPLPPLLWPAWQAESLRNGGEEGENWKCVRATFPDLKFELSPRELLFLFIFPVFGRQKCYPIVLAREKASNQRKWCLMACSAIIQISDAFSDHSFQRHSRDRAIHSKVITLQALFSEWVGWSKSDLMVLSDSCDATIAKRKMIWLRLDHSWPKQIFDRLFS